MCGWAAGNALTILFSHAAGGGTRWVETAGKPGDRWGEHVPTIQITYDANYTAPDAGAARIVDWMPDACNTGPEVEVDDLRWEVPQRHGTRGIALDADLTDWSHVPYNAQVKFRPCNRGADAPDALAGSTTCDDFVEFETYSGGIWNGVEDQASAVALSWMPSAMYCAVKVVDDVHQNPGSNSDSNEAGWNGDSVQIAFSTAERTAIGSPGRVCHS